MHTALLVVDVQLDFCPGGTLAVKDGDKVVPTINRVIAGFEQAKLPVFFTRDWHPADHISFKKQGGPWPPHCVQGTKGAGFHPSLRVPTSAVVLSKGDDPTKEAYSGFQGTDLEARLRGLGVREVYIAGLTTDYCVKETATDAVKAGFAVTVIEDCTRAVDAEPGDGVRAISQMRNAGAKLENSSSVIRQLPSTQQ